MNSSDSLLDKILQLRELLLSIKKTEISFGNLKQTKTDFMEQRNQKKKMECI